MKNIYDKNGKQLLDPMSLRPIPASFTPAFKAGDVVVFKGQSEEQRKWGGNADANSYLIVGQEYVVSSVEVRSWHTKLSLSNVTGRFNSVCFTLAN